MKDIVIVGAGPLGAALAASLREAGATVVLATRHVPEPDVSVDLGDLVRVRAEPLFEHPLPPRAALVERLPQQSNARQPERWMARPRELRTKRGK